MKRLIFFFTFLLFILCFIYLTLKVRSILSLTAQNPLSIPPVWVARKCKYEGAAPLLSYFFTSLKPNYISVPFMSRFTFLPIFLPHPTHTKLVLKFLETLIIKNIKRNNDNQQRNYPWLFFFFSFNRILRNNQTLTGKLVFQYMCSII